MSSSKKLPRQEKRGKWSGGGGGVRMVGGKAKLTRSTAGYFASLRAWD